MINVKLKGNIVKQYEKGTKVSDIAKSLGMGLYKAACVGKINGTVVDLRTPVEEDCELSILTFPVLVLYIDWTLTVPLLSTKFILNSNLESFRFKIEFSVFCIPRI